MNEPDFAFGKKLGIADCVYGNLATLASMIQRLMFCMKETNKNHGVECEFFRLDFRQPYFDETIEFPIGALILDMKWGSKKELEEKYGSAPIVDSDYKIAKGRHDFPISDKCTTAE